MNKKTPHKQVFQIYFGLADRTQVPAYKLTFPDFKHQLGTLMTLRACYMRLVWLVDWERNHWVSQT